MHKRAAPGGRALRPYRLRGRPARHTRPGAAPRRAPAVARPTGLRARRAPRRHAPGKSTLVNAFLGDEVMPVRWAGAAAGARPAALVAPRPRSRLAVDRDLAAAAAITSSSPRPPTCRAAPPPASNVPETARICRVTHARGAAPSLAPLEPGGEPVAGAAAIAGALHALNAAARGSGGPADERLLDIAAPLVALEGGDAAGGAAADAGTRLCLLDTPGPNEAGEEGLRFQVERLLCGVDAAVYLLDYTKLKVERGCGGWGPILGSLGVWGPRRGMGSPAGCRGRAHPPARPSPLHHSPCRGPRLRRRRTCWAACAASTPSSCAACAAACSLWSTSLTWQTLRGASAPTRRGSTWRRWVQGGGEGRASAGAGKSLVGPPGGARSWEWGRGRSTHRPPTRDTSHPTPTPGTPRTRPQEVTRQLALPGFILHPDQVLIASARDALLSRLILSGRASPDATTRFARAAFGPVGARGVLGQGVGPRGEALRAAARDMLAGSGVPELEGRVLGFLYDNAAGLKLMATLDDAGRLLAEVRGRAGGGGVSGGGGGGYHSVRRRGGRRWGAGGRGCAGKPWRVCSGPRHRSTRPPNRQVHNATAACAASLEADAAGLVAARDALAGEFSATLTEFDGVGRAAEELEVEVVDEVRGCEEAVAAAGRVA
jgi:hypothetical protein